MELDVPIEDPCTQFACVHTHRENIIRNEVFKELKNKFIGQIINMQVDLYQEEMFEENSVHHAKIINEFRR